MHRPIHAHEPDVDFVMVVEVVVVLAGRPPFRRAEQLERPLDPILQRGLIVVDDGHVGARHRLVELDAVELVHVELVVQVVQYVNQRIPVNPVFWEMNNGLCSLHAGQACKFDSWSTRSQLPALRNVPARKRCLHTGRRPPMWSDFQVVWTIEITNRNLK